MPGLELILSVLTKIIELVGPEIVRGQVDAYEAARKAADLLEDQKFGPKE